MTTKCGCATGWSSARTPWLRLSSDSSFGSFPTGPGSNWECSCGYYSPSSMDQEKFTKEFCSHSCMQTNIRYRSGLTSSRKMQRVQQIKLWRRLPTPKTSWKLWKSQLTHKRLSNWTPLPLLNEKIRRDSEVLLSENKIRKSHNNKFNITESSSDLKIEQLRVYWFCICLLSCK